MFNWLAFEKELSEGEERRRGKREDIKWVLRKCGGLSSTSLWKLFVSHELASSLFTTVLWSGTWAHPLHSERILRTHRHTDSTLISLWQNQCENGLLFFCFILMLIGHLQAWSCRMEKRKQENKLFEDCDGAFLVIFRHVTDKILNRWWK